MTINKSLYRWTALLLIIEGLLIFVPLIVLGNAINWPASLNEPASVNLPLILEQARGVQFGYGSYLLYSVLILPIAYMTVRIAEGDKTNNIALRMAAGFGVASATLRVLGIIRWLMPMPVLAHTYINPQTSETTQEAISITYDMLNSYAGSVGEVLGVGLFASLWILAFSIGILQTKTLPRWFAIYGFATAAALSVGLLEIVGIDVGALLTFTVSFLQFWFLLLGGMLLLQTRQSPKVKTA